MFARALAAKKNAAKPATLFSLTSILSRLRERKQSIRCAIFIFPAAASFSPLVLAEEAARQAYIPPAAGVSSGSVLQVILSLLLVLGAVVAVAWILKRINLPQQGAGNALKVISGVAVGQRERIVLVEVNDTWLVVGVAPGQVNALHTMPKGSLPSAPHTTTVDDNKFQGWLKQMMEKRNA
ncbi:MAG: flagellar biosynthetic protein FliO [Gammaproteobacteria bacterium]|nr:flagellar biosynthetic protein FliO [Gammaproteobacteria bacterium]MBU1968406.1 flagellar biosynthetic protein FliO [Gammaproteobacteria bacterium]